jgi:hypothetical protein
VQLFKRNKVLIGELLKYEDLGFTDGSMENFRDVSSLLRDKISELISVEKGLRK